MLEVITLRHGLTEWNKEKRMQGQTDIPLSPEGIQILEQYTVPAQWYEYDWHCSPLKRAKQTAECLGLKAQTHKPLSEMNWGDWEGRTHAELKAHYGQQVFSEFEDKGLDLQPPNGESPRQVQQRVSAWIDTMTGTEDTPAPIGIVVHKGVIRAMLAAAYDWNMLNKPPVKLDYQAAQRFGWDKHKQCWLLLEANIQLLPEIPA
uniref:Histidine phosphatase family protein n=1 Tax=uncultured Thiotrichaceae bacterium TaxID=298394 RepID=A0A6S6U820_9GAMM|nr:MAG: Histidine phosphatase family protein [uncultured Thiotrichaceae bacterium]